MDTILTKNDNGILVKITGRFSTDEAAPFLKETGPLMEEKNIKVIMDLSEMEYIASAGIRCFVMLLKACKANGSSLLLKDLTPQVKDIFTLTSLLDKFDVE